MKDNMPKHICNQCEYMRRVPSLFSELEIVECSKGLCKTLNIIPTGGVLKSKWKTSPAWCPLKQEEKENDRY